MRRIRNINWFEVIYAVAVGMCLWAIGAHREIEAARQLIHNVGRAVVPVSEEF